MQGRLSSSWPLRTHSSPSTIPELGANPLEITLIIYLLTYLDFVYLFLERGREAEREGEKRQCVVASCTAPSGGLAPNPDACLRLGIELATLWFVGWPSVHWATPARARYHSYRLRPTKYSILFEYCGYSHTYTVRPARLKVVAKAPPVTSSHSWPLCNSPTALHGEPFLQSVRPVTTTNCYIPSLCSVSFCDHTWVTNP